MYKPEEIIEALLSVAGSKELRTKVMKTFFLLESDYYDRTGKRLTEIEFKNWDYGPYSKTIIDIAEEDQNIKYTAGVSTKGNPYITYELRKPIDLTSKFDPFTLALIEKWGRIMKEKDLDELKKLAYEDKNFKKTEKGENITFESDFLKKKEAIKNRAKENAKLLKLKKEELEYLSKAHDEELMNFTRMMLLKSDEHKGST